MSATHTKRGLVYVTAGALIAGSLWYMRSDKAIRAEDVAELAGAVIERQVFGYLTGSTAPSFPDVRIGSSIEVATVLGKVLLPARAMATNSESAIYWLNGDVFDGQEICGYATSWQVDHVDYLPGGVLHMYITLRRPDNNLTDYAATTASRRIEGGSSAWRGTITHNAPISHTFYAGTGGSLSGKLAQGLSGNWWTDIGNGPDIYKYAIEYETTNTPPRVAHYHTITTGNLAQAANVLTNLNRTIYICNASALDCTNFVTATGVGESYYSDGSTNGPAAQLPEFIGDAWAGVIDNIDWTYSAPSAYPPAVVTPERRLAWCRRKATAAGVSIEYFDDGSGSWGASGAGEMEIESSIYRGAFLPYPSTTAIASGMVSRVVVYALTQCGLDLTDSDYTMYVGVGDTFSGSVAAITNMVSFGFGAGVDPAPFGIGVITDATKNSGIVYNLPTNYRAPSMVLRKVGEATNPTSRVYFDLGTLAPTIPGMYVYTGYERTIDIDGLNNDVIGELKDVERQRVCAVSLYCVAFAVVVDWDWRHCNPDKPFNATTNMPAWVVANTNAP